VRRSFFQFFDPSTTLLLPPVPSHPIPSQPNRHIPSHPSSSTHLKSIVFTCSHASLHPILYIQSPSQRHAKDNHTSQQNNPQPNFRYMVIDDIYAHLEYMIWKEMIVLDSKCLYLVGMAGECVVNVLWRMGVC
jgi:hypothetical protein